MKYLNKIEKNIEKIKLLQDVYDNILNKKITSDDELMIAKLKAKVAKQEMLHLIYEIHRILEKIK